jgi:phage/plasmid-like protein (TIGR03299 family)
MAKTTTAGRDVNAEFAGERADLIGRVQNWNEGGGREQALAESQAAFDRMVAQGTFVDLGGGRYQQTTGMDKGECWTLTRPNKLGQLMAMPEHGLDEMDGGRVRLYTAVPAWHGLGQYIPGGTEDIEDVVKLGGIDFDIIRLPAPAYEYDGQLHEVPGLFHQVRGDNGAYLGTTGRIHRNIHPRDAMAFMQNIVGKDKPLTWESAGALKGGAKVFVSAKLPEGIVVDAEGVSDYQDLFLVVLDDRAGGASFQGMMTPWRPLCSNTNRFATRDAVSRIRLRHTTNLPDHVKQARDLLGLTFQYAEAFAAEETALARTNTSITEFRELMGELFAAEARKDDPAGRVYGGRLRDAESKLGRAANDRREADLEERWGTEKNRVGETLYAAEQAYTGHLDWGITRKGDSPAARWQARIAASLEGEADELKTRAHSRLLQLAGGGTETR